MAYGYARGGHVEEAKKVLALASNAAERLAVIKQIAPVLKTKGFFLNRESALLTLALFDPESQIECARLLEKLESKGEMKVDLIALVPKASQLHPLITKPSVLTRPVNFRYKLGTTWPFIQEWLLLTGINLIKTGKISNDIFLSISTFLAPLSNGEALQLSNKMFSVYRPELFHSSLAKHHHLLATGESISGKEEKHSFGRSQ